MKVHFYLYKPKNVFLNANRRSEQIMIKKITVDFVSFFRSDTVGLNKAFLSHDVEKDLMLKRIASNFEDVIVH